MTGMNCWEPKPELVAADRDIVAETWVSSGAYDLVERLCGFGSRFAGTAGEQKAVSFLVDRMKSLGLSNVRAEEFPYSGWIRKTAALRTISPSSREFFTVGLPHSPSCLVRGELAYVGFGTPGDFVAHSGKLAGKVVLVDARSPAYLNRIIHRHEKYSMAEKEGAVGFIWMRDQGGLLPETGSLAEGCKLPGIGVARETGMELVRMTRLGPVVVEIEMDNEIREMTSWNVVGDLEGGRWRDRVVVVGAHLDGHDVATGALDCASGCAVVLETARMLARHRDQLERSVRFCCFGAEEIGLYGSHAYVNAHEHELDPIEFMLNVDGFGIGGTKGLALQDWPELIPRFRELARVMDFPLIVDTVFQAFSDMYPFSLHGVPSGYMWPMDSVPTSRNWGHTAADTLDKVSPVDLKLEAMLVARLMFWLAVWPEQWPASRHDPERIRTMLRQAGLQG